MPATVLANPVQLKGLLPFAEMKPAQMASLASKCRVLDVPKGKILFKHGQDNELCHWLLSGTVDLLDLKYNITPVTGGSERAQRMLDIHDPHALTAVTSDDCRVAVVARKTLDMALTVDQGGGLIVAEAASDEDKDLDWMSALLNTHLFELLPPANIQKAFSRFEEVHLKAGARVIDQGAEGDYFYVLKKGSAKIYRTRDGQTEQLAEVGPGACFGEDALVSDAPRNATVEMTTAGSVMRLNKPDFQELLQNPAAEYVTMDEVDAALIEGESQVVLIDVRMASEFAEDGIEGATNIPLGVLRDRLQELSHEATYVTCCDGGRRSELAAYILNENGFDAVILKSE